MLRNCTKCKKEKNISEYHKKSKYKDGYSPWCKECTSIVNKEYNNREEVKTRRKDKFLDNTWREQKNAKERERNRRNPKRKLLNHARERAKKQNIECTITQNDINIPPNCPVLDISLCIGDGIFHNGSPTIDRIDNSKGYTSDNIKVISWRANSIKRDANINELDKIIKYMSRQNGIIKLHL